MESFLALDNVIKTRTRAVHGISCPYGVCFLPAELADHDHTRSDQVYPTCVCPHIAIRVHLRSTRGMDGTGGGSTEAGPKRVLGNCTRSVAPPVHAPGESRATRKLSIQMLPNPAPGLGLARGRRPNGRKDGFSAPTLQARARAPAVQRYGDCRRNPLNWANFSGC